MRLAVVRLLEFEPLVPHRIGFFCRLFALSEYIPESTCGKVESKSTRKSANDMVSAPRLAFLLRDFAEEKPRSARPALPLCDAQSCSRTTRQPCLRRRTSSRVNTPSTSPRRFMGSPSRRGLLVRWLRCVPSRRPSTRDFLGLRRGRSRATAGVRSPRDAGATRAVARRVVRTERRRHLGERDLPAGAAVGFPDAPIVAFFPSIAAREETPLTPSPALSHTQVKKFAQKTMKTSDVRVDVKLNKAIWSKGIRNVRLPPRASLPGTPPRAFLDGARVFAGATDADRLAFVFFSARNRFPAKSACRSPAAATTTRTRRRTSTPT